MFKNKKIFNNLNKIFKLSILLFNSKIKRVWNYNDLLLGVRVSRMKMIGFIAPQKNLLHLLKFIYFLKTIIFLEGGKVLFVDNNSTTCDISWKSVLKINQYFIGKPLNISGSLTNFSHMRWYALRANNTTFPYKKPSALILLDSYKPYFPIIGESVKLNIPLIAPPNFDTTETNKKLVYPLLIPKFDHVNKKLFYFEIFTYIINLCNVTNYYVNYNIDNVRELYLSSLYGRCDDLSFIDNSNHAYKLLNNNPISYSNKLQTTIIKNLWKFVFSKRRVRFKFRVQLYDFNKTKKWQWYRKKKFKYISLYFKNFIKKGKFKAPFSKFKWRYSLLKQIFCNLFDLQYNYKTWWREVIKKGLYKKIKNFRKNFKSVENFLLNSERYLIFLVKKHFNHTFKNLSVLIKQGSFIINGKPKFKPEYVIKNDTIIQKKLFNTDADIVFNLYQTSKWHLSLMWRQSFFRYSRYFGRKTPKYTVKGIPLIHPKIVDYLDLKKKLFFIYQEKMKFWNDKFEPSLFLFNKKNKLLLKFYTVILNSKIKQTKLWQWPL